MAAMGNCSKLLGATAKGGSLNSFAADALQNDKKLITVVKSGNAAIRTAQAFIKTNKEECAEEVCEG